MFVLCLSIAASVAFTQENPNKPIRVIASGPGGNTDSTARIVTQELSAAVSQPVIVDNRPAGVIPAQIVSRAVSDGYTLLITANSMWISSLLQKTPYDPVKDF